MNIYILVLTRQSPGHDGEWYDHGHNEMVDNVIVGAFSDLGKLEAAWQEYESLSWVLDHYWTKRTVDEYHPPEALNPKRKEEHDTGSN